MAAQAILDTLLADMLELIEVGERDDDSVEADGDGDQPDTTAVDGETASKDVDVLSDSDIRAYLRSKGYTAALEAYEQEVVNSTSGDAANAATLLGTPALGRATRESSMTEEGEIPSSSPSSSGQVPALASSNAAPSTTIPTRVTPHEGLSGIRKKARAWDTARVKIQQLIDACTSIVNDHEDEMPDMQVDASKNTQDKEVSTVESRQTKETAVQTEDGELDVEKQRKTREMTDAGTCTDDLSFIDRISIPLARNVSLSRLKKQTYVRDASAESDKPPRPLPTPATNGHTSATPPAVSTAAVPPAGSRAAQAASLLARLQGALQSPHLCFSPADLKALTSPPSSTSSNMSISPPSQSQNQVPPSSHMQVQAQAPNPTGLPQRPLFPNTQDSSGLPARPSPSTQAQADARLQAKEKQTQTVSVKQLVHSSLPARPTFSPSTTQLPAQPQTQGVTQGHTKKPSIQLGKVYVPASASPPLSASSPAPVAASSSLPPALPGPSQMGVPLPRPYPAPVDPRRARQAQLQQQQMQQQAGPEKEKERAQQQEASASPALAPVLHAKETAVGVTQVLPRASEETAKGPEQRPSFAAAAEQDMAAATVEETESTAPTAPRPSLLDIVPEYLRNRRKVSAGISGTAASLDPAVASTAVVTAVDGLPAALEQAAVAFSAGVPDLPAQTSQEPSKAIPSSTDMDIDATSALPNEVAPDASNIEDIELEHLFDDSIPEPTALPTPTPSASLLTAPTIPAKLAPAFSKMFARRPQVIPPRPVPSLTDNERLRSGRPIPLAQRQGAVIDKERARLIHEENAEKARRERERRWSSLPQRPGSMLDTIEPETTIDDAGDTTMDEVVDEVLGQSEDNDEHAEAEAAPESLRSTEAEAMTETPAQALQNNGTVSRSISPAPLDGPSTNAREKELRLRLKRLRGEADGGASSAGPAKRAALEPEETSTAAGSTVNLALPTEAEDRAIRHAHSSIDQPPAARSPSPAHSDASSASDAFVAATLTASKPDTTTRSASPASHPPKSKTARRRLVPVVEVPCRRPITSRASRKQKATASTKPETPPASPAPPPLATSVSHNAQIQGKVSPAKPAASPLRGQVIEISDDDSSDEDTPIRPASKTLAATKSPFKPSPKKPAPLTKTDEALSLTPEALAFRAKLVAQSKTSDRHGPAVSVSTPAIAEPAQTSGTTPQQGFPSSSPDVVYSKAEVLRKLAEQGRQYITIFKLDLAELQAEGKEVSETHIRDHLSAHDPVEIFQDATTWYATFADSDGAETCRAQLDEQPLLGLPLSLEVEDPPAVPKTAEVQEKNNAQKPFTAAAPAMPPIAPPDLMNTVGDSTTSSAETAAVALPKTGAKAGDPRLLARLAAAKQTLASTPPASARSDPMNTQMTGQANVTASSTDETDMPSAATSAQVERLVDDLFSQARLPGPLYTSINRLATNGISASQETRIMSSQSPEPQDLDEQEVDELMKDIAEDSSSGSDAIAPVQSERVASSHSPPPASIVTRPPGSAEAGVNEPDAARIDSSVDSGKGPRSTLDAIASTSSTTVDAGQTASEAPSATFSPQRDLIEHSLKAALTPADPDDRVDRPSSTRMVASDLMASPRLTEADLLAATLETPSTPPQESGSHPSASADLVSPAARTVVSEADSVEIVMPSPRSFLPLPDMALEQPIPKCKYALLCLNMNCTRAHPARGAAPYADLPKVALKCPDEVFCPDPTCPKMHPSPAAARNDYCKDQDNCPHGAKCAFKHVDRARSQVALRRQWPSHNQSVVFNTGNAVQPRLSNAANLATSSTASNTSAAPALAGQPAPPGPTPIIPAPALAPELPSNDSPSVAQAQPAPQRTSGVFGYLPFLRR